MEGVRDPPTPQRTEIQTSVFMKTKGTQSSVTELMKVQESTDGDHSGQEGARAVGSAARK